jgi:hypothetical protein
LDLVLSSMHVSCFKHAYEQILTIIIITKFVSSKFVTGTKRNRKLNTTW